jgi:type III restriction enzyme
VYERLAKDFANGKIFIELPFIPDRWKSKWNLNIKLRGDESPLAAENNFVLNNIHQLYESRTKEFNPNNIIEAILGRKPQKDPGKSPQTLLERMKELDNLLVMNDEAHHVHDDELKWNESLLAIHRHIPGGLKIWLDFSATPKTPENTYYPWIICDYPLAQAVEDRIVKVPLIVHTVNKKDPEHITGDNVADYKRNLEMFYQIFLAAYFKMKFDKTVHFVTENVQVLGWILNLKQVHCNAMRRGYGCYQLCRGRVVEN